MSSYRQNYFELAFKDRLSVADAIALVHHLGVNKAAAFVSVVDPWRFPHDDAPATINVKGQVQSVVAKATLLGNTLNKFTGTSISAFLLLSPLLVKKGERPSLVLKPKSERSKSSPKAVVTAAATVARKPTSQPVDLPINEGMNLQNFRLPLPPPHHPISLLIKHSPLPGGIHVID